MKLKSILIVCSNTVFAALLAFLTLNSILAVKGVAHSEGFGWLSISPIGPLYSTALFLFLLLVFALDFLWGAIFRYLDYW